MARLVARVVLVALFVAAAILYLTAPQPNSTGGVADPPVPASYDSSGPFALVASP